MEAKDTTMKFAEMNRVYNKAWSKTMRETNPSNEAKALFDATEAICQAQAEISFKAGEDNARNDWNKALDIALPEAYKAGIREVVEWIGINNRITYQQPRGANIPRDIWQAKLKEWGIEEVTMK